MKLNNQLALIVSYYLSRCDKVSDLGYSSFTEATKKIGKILDVKPRTIQNMRDEFDPYNENKRRGWVRELRGSRLKVAKAFQHTDDETLFQIVMEILNNKDFQDTEEYKDIQTIFKERPKPREKKGQLTFILRGPTGRAAEQFFVEYFRNKKQPLDGKLLDCRDLGCGYDFEIKNREGSFFIEVKGLSSDGGGLLFTNKEWQTALKNKDRYYLVLVSNISGSPKVNIVQDPASKLNAKRSIYTTIQINWSVLQKDLNF